ncbi:sensor histidine kinase [Actinomadura madurae]|uniref:sensor histidine kinase n=1 Tax=Actinomadura madurae TaxID=1993 RepID=UPI002025D6AE|nr:histidine kinase [Actinomadura madurae]MCP9947907.1 histidine kinase [Actinomadura madurae]MCP9964682.1 histidine kinase [Actinomadura madurae]MCP9977149.1 histidine kinase [Actinomadura madurae]MCQ0011332.1 histidine kinase [Actinomadura madurae]MCQ0013351.1 histidine kinase [Actinomadura madurae]
MHRLRRLTTRQDALIAAAALAGGLAVLAAHGYTLWSKDWDVSLWVRLVPLSGLCLAMPLRRTAPITGLLLATPFNVADVVFGPSLATAMIYGDALYAASLYGRRRTAEWLLGVTLAGSLAVAAGVAIALHGVAVGVVGGSVAGVVWVAPVLTAMAVREHRERAEAERQRAEQVARLAEMDRRAAVTAERARMARELHDVIANHLSAVALHSSAVLKVPDLDRDGVNRAMEVIRENSVRGLAEMRRMIGLLREGGAEDPAAQPRLAELGRLVRGSARSDLSARLEVTGDPPELPAAVELAAYRIVQEALTNALKHAGPGHADVRVAYGGRRVVIDVLSPLGRDGSRLPGTGSGLVGMRERAVMLAGEFDAGPDGAHWRVHAELPVDHLQGERAS